MARACESVGRNDESLRQLQSSMHSLRKPYDMQPLNQKGCRRKVVEAEKQTNQQQPGQKKPLRRLLTAQQLQPRQRQWKRTSQLSHRCALALAMPAHGQLAATSQEDDPLQQLLQSLARLLRRLVVPARSRLQPLPSQPASLPLPLPYQRAAPTSPTANMQHASLRGAQTGCFCHVLCVVQPSRAAEPHCPGQLRLQQWLQQGRPRQRRQRESRLLDLPYLPDRSLQRAHVTVCSAYCAWLTLHPRLQKQQAKLQQSQAEL